MSADKYLSIFFVYLYYRYIFSVSDTAMFVSKLWMIFTMENHVNVLV